MNQTSLNPYSTPQSRENSVQPSIRDGTIAYLAAGLFVANAMLTLAWLSYFCTVGTSYTLTGATSWTATLREYVAMHGSGGGEPILKSTSTPAAP